VSLLSPSPDRFHSDTIHYTGESGLSQTAPSAWVAILYGLTTGRPSSCHSQRPGCKPCATRVGGIACRRPLRKYVWIKGSAAALSHHARVIGKPTPQPLRDLAAIFNALFLPHKHEALIIRNNSLRSEHIITATARWGSCWQFTSVHPGDWRPTCSSAQVSQPVVR